MAKDWIKKARQKNKVDFCKLCGAEFKHNTWDNQEFCSRECYFNSVRQSCECSVCGKMIKKSPTTLKRNTNNYCSRQCYESRRKDNLRKLKRNTNFFDNLLSSTPCNCGVSETYLLQIHHIDGNHKNNNPDNLEIVCGNCHIKRHLKKRDRDGRWVYSPKTLTNRELLNSL